MSTSQPPPKTFSLQDTLPRLPIPELKDTARLYLQTLRPVLTPEEYTQSEANVTEFIKAGGAGEIRQTRLHQVDKEEPNSWLERWWLSLAYHGWREAVMINSNWFMSLRNHPETPAELLRGEKMTAQFTDFQVKRAAGFVSNLLNYKAQLDTETFPIDSTRAGPLDMNQYRQVFGITRVPKPGCDINVGSHPCTSGHIVVFVRDQIYRVDVNDSNTGERVGISEIEKQLQAVVKDVKRGENIQAPIGLLTAIHRDKWAELHEHLEKLSPSNRENFHEIETALFAVSLDDYTLPTNIEYLARNTAHAMNGRNRWFDKSISVCIMADGRTGINGEHSPCDALIPAMMADEVVKNEPARDPPHLKQHPTLQPPRKLLWKVDPKVINGLEEAQKVVTKDIANSDVKILQYSSYGSTFMKKIGKASPDAYMQMALQLTFFRVHGKFAPVYETASTRQYKHGRTETCRSLSLECKEFVEAFSNPSASNTDRYARFQKACAAHVKYLTIAGQGRGVDRHLLGLRMLGQPGEPVPAIFSDPAYAKSSHWQLSTSGLFPGDRILATGFGSVVEDGYGMNYMIAPDLIKIGVESKIACKDTSSARFTETLQRVLDDIAQMCRDINGDNAKPKL